MTDARKPSRTDRGRAGRPGFFRRYWVILLTLVLLLAALSAAVVFWWVPTRVERVITAMEHRAGELLALDISHRSAHLEGTTRLVIEDLSATATAAPDDGPMVTARRILVDFDPYTFKDGVPVLIGVRIEGVQVQVWAAADGRDNFSETTQGILDLLRRSSDGDGGKKPSRLVRLLKQLPPVEIRDVTVRGHFERGTTADGTRTVVHLRWENGTIEAANPSETGLEKRLRFRALFDDALNRNGRVRLEGELNRSADTASLSARFERGLPVEAGPATLRLDGVTWVKGQLLEVNIGDLQTDIPAMDDLVRLGGALMGVDGETRAAALAGRIIQARDQALARLLGLAKRAEQARDALVSMGYGAASVDRTVAGWSDGVGDLLTALTEPTRRTSVTFDKVRLTRVKDHDAGAEIWVLHLLQAGEAEVWGHIRRDVDTRDLSIKWRLGYTPLGLSLEGRTAVVAGEVDTDFEGRLALEVPHMVLEGSGAWSEGRLTLEGDVEARIDEPPLAVTASGLLRGDVPEGTAELRADVDGLVRDLRIQGLAKDGRWSVEIGGDVEAPGHGQQARLAAALDSTAGLKKLSLHAKEPVGFDIGDHRFHLHGLSLGLDQELRLEDITVTRAGADISRKLLSLKSLRVRLSEPLSKGTIDAFVAARSEGTLEQEILARVAEVELMEPHVFLRQPNPLPMDEVEELEHSPKDFDADLDRKLAGDARPGKRSEMHAPLRQGLSRTVLGLEGRAGRLLGLLHKLGDRFPLEKVTIVAGRLEYADAVAEEDRLVTDLSHFNGTFEKMPGGGTFRMEVGFLTPSANGEVSNRFEAEINLVTGDISGTLDLPGFPLYPYRFLAPRALVISPSSRLADTRLKFAYQVERNIVQVWGIGRLDGLTVSSNRIASEPLRNLELAFDLGRSADQAVTLDLGAHVLDTGEHAGLRLGSGPMIRTRLRLDCATPEFPKFIFGLGMDITPFQQVLDSIPSPLIQNLAGMRAQGYIALETSITGDSADLGNLEFDFRFQEREVSVDTYGQQVDMQKLLGPFTFRIRGGGKEAKTIRVGEGPLWTSISDIPPWMILAVTTTEDGSFFRHEGFNRFQWKMSIIDNLEAGRYVRGASTISMQLVKNLFLGHQKTAARKFQELLLTWLMEKEVPKERIIELYLNIIEWGRGVYGLADAAQHYFRRPARQVTQAQAALLATFIPYPRPFDDRFQKGLDVGARTKSWNQWWARRLKLVKQVTRAMVNNCDRVDAKCPTSTGNTCRALHRMCGSGRSVFYEAENLQSLDKLIEPPEVDVDTAVDIGVDDAVIEL
ncbi:MAG: biosynthetic peptidoglycan transglycosylase [Pseudomonadota bacterium]